MATKKPGLLDREDSGPDTTLTKVKLFNCEVRLNGDIMHTAWKFGITNGEMRVLRAIHGDTALMHVTEVGEKEVNELEELYSLAVKYPREGDIRRGLKRIEQIFGVKLDGFEEWNEMRWDRQEARRREQQDKMRANAARFARARLAADARVQAEMASETAGDAA